MGAQTPYLEMASAKAKETMNRQLGGPFGACVVDPLGNVIALASNSVLKDNDPTAHAEMNAIRLASKQLGTYNLTGCTLYTTAYPCPMCLSAIIWANIHHVVYGTPVEEAAKIGFRDDHIYKFIQEEMMDEKVLKIEHQPCPLCSNLFNEYTKNNHRLY